MLRAQYLAHFSGGEVAASDTRYGRANLNFIKKKFSLKGFQKTASLDES
jgi:hypothetical protein